MVDGLSTRLKARSTIRHQPSAQSNRTGQWLLAIALLSGIGLTAPVLWAGPLVLDEHGSYWIIDSNLPGSSLERSLSYAAIPPLSAWVQSGALGVGGKTEGAFRASSAVCYLLAIAVTWLLGRDLCGPVAGGLAAITLALHPEALDEVRIARCYGLVLLTSSALLWITVRWLRAPQRPAWGAAWGFAAAAVAWTHYMAVPLVGLAFLPSVWTALLCRRQRGACAVALWLAVLVCGVLCLPLVPAILRMWEWSPFLNYQRETQSVWRIIGPLWIVGLPAGLAIAWILSGLRPDRAHEAVASRSDHSPVTTHVSSLPPYGTTSFPLRRSLSLLALWALFPIVLIALAAHGDLTSLANPRYRVAYAAPGACLLAGLLTSIRGRAIHACLATAAALSAAWSVSPRLPWQLSRLGSPDAAEWKQAANIVEQEGGAGEPLFVQSGLIESSLVPAYYRDPLFMEYVACRMGRFYIETPHPRYGLPFLWETNPEMRAYFVEVLAEGRRASRDDVWLACATDTDLNRRSLEGMRTLIEQQGYQVREQWDFPALVLVRYACPDAGAPE